MRVPQALCVVASQQCGVVSRWQLRALGISDRAERFRINSGAWAREFGAIVVDRNAASSELRTAWALTLSSRVPTIISGPTSAKLQGWDLQSSLVVGRTEQHLSVPGAILRRLSGPSLARHGLLFTPREVALLDTLTSGPLDEARATLDRALQQHFINPERFVQLATERARRVLVDTRRLKDLIARASTGSRSEAEQRMWPIVRRTGISGWVANYPVRDETGRVRAELDFALESAMLAIEIDGRAYHSDTESFEKDRSRQNLLTVMGWTVLRFTWGQITQRPDEVLRTILLALTRAA